MLQPISRRSATRRSANQALAALRTSLADLRILHQAHPETLDLVNRMEADIEHVQRGLEVWRKSETPTLPLTGASDDIFPL